MTMAIAFSRQNDDASRERTLHWENLVLVVVLESFLICKHRRKSHAVLKPFSDISLTLQPDAVCERKKEKLNSLQN